MRKMRSNCPSPSPSSMTLRMVLLRGRSGRADASAENDSPDVGVGAAELAIELIEVIVLLRLTFLLVGMLPGTGGGGIARSVVSLAIL